jgi:hypothetical protein
LSKFIPSILVLVGVGLGFIFGYLAGSGAPTNRVTISPTVQSKLTSEMVRDEIDAALEVYLAQELRTGNPTTSSGSMAEVQIGSSGRTPNWAEPLEQIDQAVARLDDAISSLERKSGPSLKSQILMALSGDYPTQLEEFVRVVQEIELQTREQGRSTTRESLLYLSPVEVLRRFGEPHEMDLRDDRLEWEYETTEWVSPEGERFYIELQFEFVAGMAADVGWSMDRLK